MFRGSFSGSQEDRHRADVCRSEGHKVTRSCSRCCYIFRDVLLHRETMQKKKKLYRSDLIFILCTRTNDQVLGPMDPSLRKFEQIHKLHESLRASASSRHNATCPSVACHFAHGGHAHAERRLCDLGELAGGNLKVTCALPGEDWSGKRTGTFAAFKDDLEDREVDRSLSERAGV
jgi:hypothetical protein